MNIQSNKFEILDFKSDYIDTFMKYHNNLDWMKYQGFKGLSKFEYERELLYNTSILKGKQFAIVDKISKDLIGDIYLKKEDSTYLLGYTINPEFSQKGYAKEALISIIKWIKDQDGKIIKAYVLSENIKSINLLKSLNFLYSSTIGNELLYIYYL